VNTRRPILVSHNIPHIFELSDRIFVIRLGRKAGDLVTRETSINDVVSLITGVQLSDVAPASS
jgi:fructose transport system ATP-binding protein